MEQIYYLKIETNENINVIIERITGVVNDSTEVEPTIKVKNLDLWNMLQGKIEYFQNKAEKYSQSASMASNINAQLRYLDSEAVCLAKVELLQSIQSQI